METTVNKENYVWIIVQTIDQEESLVGLSDDNGAQFVPATNTKEEALVLMGRLPKVDNAKFQVEAIHTARLLEEAGKSEFEVFKVDQDGTVLEHLQTSKIN